MVLAEAAASGAGGPCRLPGVAGETFHVPQDALALGALAHAFEFDNLRKPGTGVHPGATVALPAFAMAQALNASGASLVAATVAGIEIMFRIGAATLHSPEKIGFHAPGLTGPFGAAAACASLMRMSAQETANAFGIAGSLAGGLMAFAKAGSGGMVKRLHLGRAAEGEVVAARRRNAFEGPRNVPEGRYGLLEAFCDDKNPALLTKGLGQTYETDRVCFKRYPCHVTAHVPVQLLRGFMEQHRFGGGDIRDLTIEASAKVASHHSERDSADIMLAQYSVPFCVAIAAHHDPLDPSVFCAQVVGETRVRDLARRIRMATDETIKGWGAGMRARCTRSRVRGASDTGSAARRRRCRLRNCARSSNSPRKTRRRSSSPRCSTTSCGWSNSRRWSGSCSPDRDRAPGHFPSWLIGSCALPGKWARNRAASRAVARSRHLALSDHKGKLSVSALRQRRLRCGQVAFAGPLFVAVS